MSLYVSTGYGFWRDAEERAATLSTREGKAQAFTVITEPHTRMNDKPPVSLYVPRGGLPPPRLRYGSVCSGIEAATVAWHPLGWTPAWFAEIEPFPCAVLKHHYPQVPNLGDITDPDFTARTSAVDVLVGGTPCQAFSMAGLRGGMSDPRGQLTRRFVEIADALDPSVVLWENVPGVLSSEDNAFGCLLAGLAGEDVPLLPPGGKWTNAGGVLGPKRTVVWRIIDAQYCGVAQRRRRVFVVASPRTGGVDPRKILFECEGMRRDSPPSREAREEVASTIAGGARRCDGYSHDDVQLCVTGSLTHPLRAEGADASEDGTGRGVPIVAVKTQAIAFSCKDHAADAGPISPTLRSMNHEGSHANGGGQVAIAFHCNAQPDQMRFSEHVSDSLTRSQNAAVAYCAKVAQPVRTNPYNNSDPGMEAQGHVAYHNKMVRRLTPVECERLQAFPDNYTRIPWDKDGDTPDGHRYRALGNSMCVYVMRWIGVRIGQEVERVALERILG